MRNEKGQFVKGSIPPNKGIKGLLKHSDKIRIMISEKLKGRKKPLRSLEHRLKLSMARKGKPTNTGKHWKLSEKARENISNGHRGKKSYSWKGGLTPLVRQIRRCFRYRQWRSDIFTRDNFTCVLCNKKGGWIEADHYPISFRDIFYGNNIKTLEEALACEELWNINNGRTLCKDDHNKNKKR